MHTGTVNVQILDTRAFDNFSCCKEMAISTNHCILNAVALLVNNNLMLGQYPEHSMQLLAQGIDVAFTSAAFIESFLW